MCGIIHKANLFSVHYFFSSFLDFSSFFFWNEKFGSMVVKYRRRTPLIHWITEFIEMKSVCSEILLYKRLFCNVELRLVMNYIRRCVYIPVMEVYKILNLNFMLKQKANINLHENNNFSPTFLIINAI